MGKNKSQARKPTTITMSAFEDSGVGLAPPTSSQQEAESSTGEIKRTPSFKGLPPIRRGSTFGISLKEATAQTAAEDDIPPVPAIRPQSNPEASVHDPALLHNDISLAPADHGTNVSIGQDSNATLVGQDSTGRTRRTSLGLKESHRDSHRDSHRSFPPSNLPLTVDTLTRANVPEMPQIPAHFESNPIQTQPPSGWQLEESHLSEPLHQVSRRRADTSPQQPVVYGYDKETGLSSPVSPVQGSSHHHRPSNPPSSAQRYPELFGPSNQTPSRSRASSAGQSDQIISRFSTDSDQKPLPPVWNIKRHSPNLDENGRSRAIFKNIGDRFSRGPPKDGRSSSALDIRSDSTDTGVLDDDGSDISAEPEPRRKRTSILTGLRSRQSLDGAPLGRPESPALSNRTPSIQSERKPSFFSAAAGKVSAMQHKFASSNLSKTTSLSAVNESAPAGSGSSITSGNTSLKSKFSGLSGLAGKLYRPNFQNKETQSQVQISQTGSDANLSPEIPIEPPPKAPGRISQHAGLGVPPGPPPPRGGGGFQETQGRRPSASGATPAFMGGRPPLGLEQKDEAPRSPAGIPDTPPPKAPNRPGQPFGGAAIPARVPVAAQKPTPSDGAPRWVRPTSTQAPPRPSPLAQESFLNPETSSVESADAAEHDRNRESAGSPTTARTSGPSQVDSKRGSGPLASKFERADSPNNGPKSIDGLGENRDGENYGASKASLASGSSTSTPNDGPPVPAKRQPANHPLSLLGSIKSTESNSSLRPGETVSPASEDRITSVQRKPVGVPGPTAQLGPKPPSQTTWGSAADALPENKALKQDNLPGPPAMNTQVSMASLATAARRAPSPQPSAFSSISAAQNQGDSSGRQSPLVLKPEGKKSSWKAWKSRASSQPKEKSEKSTGGGLFSALRRGSKPQPPPKEEVGVQNVNSVPFGGPESQGQPKRPIPASRPLIPAPAGRVGPPAPALDQQQPFRQQQQQQKNQPAHWDNPQSLGILGNGPHTNGEPKYSHESQELSRQYSITNAPEPQYDSVPIPKGYTAVHGEGSVALTQYHLNQQNSFPQYPYAAAQQGYYAAPTLSAQPQPQPQPQTLPPVQQQPGPQVEAEIEPKPRQDSLVPASLNLTKRIPSGPVVPQSREQGSAEVSRSVQPQIVYHQHSNSASGVIPTPASQDEFVLPIQGTETPRIGSQPRKHSVGDQIDEFLANSDRPNIARENSVVSDGGQSIESGVMGPYASAKSKPAGKERQQDELHLKVGALSNSDISRENSSASSNGPSQPRVARQVEMTKVVSPATSVSNDALKGSNSGPSRSISVEEQNSQPRPKPELKQTPDQQQQQQRLRTPHSATTRDSSEDIYDATPRIKQGQSPEAQTKPHPLLVSNGSSGATVEGPRKTPQRKPAEAGGSGAFTVELEDTADARMRTLRLNEQEEKIFYDPEGELPKMQATSYPGQEWNPYGDVEFSEWNDE